MHYISTRDDTQRLSFSEAILQGQSPEGGLFFPAKIPQISREELEILQTKSHQERTAFLYAQFAPEIPESEVLKLINAAYSEENFAAKDICPLRHLHDNIFIQELYHGPTAAFKDMALQLLPRFFASAQKAYNPDIRYLIVTATSGDTGSSALYGYGQDPRNTMLVLYPIGGTSDIQRQQMVTATFPNVKVIGMHGDFDAIQTQSVKAVFEDQAFLEEIWHTYGVQLSSANSINWGRLIPQMAYHLSGYLDLVQQKILKLGDPCHVSVPSGNFGNLLSAYILGKMGIPFQKYICGSNTNDILTEFLQTGLYDMRARTLAKTLSPSMDILISSNIERLLFLLLHKNTLELKAIMQSLKKESVFEVSDEIFEILRNDFFAQSLSDEQTLESLRYAYHNSGRILDPHTAIAYQAAMTYRQKYEGKDHLPCIVSGTAHWAKFPRAIAQAFGIADEGHDDFNLIERLLGDFPQESFPHGLYGLQNKKIIHGDEVNVGKASLQDQIRIFLKALYG